MTSISTAPTVKAALRARLAAEPLLAAVQIAHGSPYPDRLERELVVVGRALAQSTFGDRYPSGQRPRNLGPSGAREERYTVELHVSVVGAARDRYPTLEARAYAIADAIDANIRLWQQTTPQPYDGVARWVIVTAVEDNEALTVPGREETPAEGGRECAVLIKLDVAAGI